VTSTRASASWCGRAWRGARASSARCSHARPAGAPDPLVARRLTGCVEPGLEERVEVLAGDLLRQRRELLRRPVAVRVLARPRLQDVEELPRVIREKSIDVMVIAVPAKAAQNVLNRIMSAKIKAVLNFAPVSLTARLGVKVKTVDLTTSLESLSYFLARPKDIGMSTRSRAKVVGAEDHSEQGLRR